MRLSLSVGDSYRHLFFASVTRKDFVGKKMEGNLEACKQRQRQQQQRHQQRWRHHQRQLQQQQLTKKRKYVEHLNVKRTSLGEW